MDFEEDSNPFSIVVTVAPKECYQCGTRLRRTKKKSWRKGRRECPNGHPNWYGRGRQIKVRRRRVRQRV